MSISEQIEINFQVGVDLIHIYKLIQDIHPLVLDLKIKNISGNLIK